VSILKQKNIIGIIDPREAPLGYYAVLKEDVSTPILGNICRACDWRAECQKRDTDFTLHNHRCMGYPIVGSNGKITERDDGCSVVFKKLQNKMDLG
jgi:hypothetical protein